jgi:hypothetical protein
VDGWVDGEVCVFLYDWMDECTVGTTDGRIDGWVERRKERRCGGRNVF